MLHQTMLNPDGRRRASFVGYAAQRESYMSEQQVVEYRSSQAPRISSPKKITNYNYDEPETLIHGNPFLVPWSSPRGGNKDHRVAGEFSPRKSSSPNYGKSSERFHGNQDYFSNYNHDDSEYEELDEDGYEEYDDDDDVKGKNRVSFRDDHRKDRVKSYYDQGSYNTHDDVKYYKGKNEYSSPRSNYGTSPFSNKPKKETQYEPSHGSPIGNNSGLAPIKTKPNYPNRAMDYYPNNIQRMGNTNYKEMQQPKYSSPKSKDHWEYPETIDSNEARRRYANKSSPRPVVEEGYRHTIDSREAARRYKGAFIP